jgi:hypothetical protein
MAAKRLLIEGCSPRGDMMLCAVAMKLTSKTHLIVRSVLPIRTLVAVQALRAFELIV